MAKRFSERIGARKERLLQLQEIDDELRNSLWNGLLDLFRSENDRAWGVPAEALARDVFKVPVDSIPDSQFRKRKWVRERFYDLPWHGVYDVIEYIVQDWDYIRALVSKYLSPPRARGLSKFFNAILEKERSAYRFVNKTLVPISNTAEVAEVEQAIKRSGAHGLDGAHKHLGASLGLLGKKPEPDYRNAIKEAISAVESVCNQMGGEKSRGLQGALSKLEEEVTIHRALKSAFVKLYGYTSDEDGIRHAILEDPNVGFDEAKFMVVSCSAFVNYLICKAHAAGLIKAGD